MSAGRGLARVPDLITYGQLHNLKMISVASLIRYRLEHERFLRRKAEGILPTRYGVFRTIAYESPIDPETHMALVMGDISGKDNVLVRMHSHCVFGDVFHSLDCECSSAWLWIRPLPPSPPTGCPLPSS